MANNTPDFVQVRLTPAGVQQANGTPLTVTNGRRLFTFNGLEALKVEISYEWKAFLSHVHLPNGEPLCEVVPLPPAHAPIELPAKGNQPFTPPAEEAKQ